MDRLARSTIELPRFGLRPMGQPRNLRYAVPSTAASSEKGRLRGRIGCQRFGRGGYSSSSDACRIYTPIWLSVPGGGGAGLIVAVIPTESGALVLARELGVASGLLASQPER